MNGLIENLKGKLRSCFNGYGSFENNAMLILMIFFVAILTLLQVACSQQPDSDSAWDKPFGSPQYLLHATGHGTMDGPRTDDWWFLNPNQPKNGYMELPDGMGGTFTYSIDQSMGPFNTPREVCTAAGGKTKDNSIGGFNCKDMVAQPENTNKPNQTEGGPCANACDKSKHLVWDGYAGCSCICENGWNFDEHGNCEPSEISDFESELLLDLEPQGTIETIKAGDEITVPKDENAKLILKCKNIQNQILLLDMFFDTGAWDPFYPLGTVGDDLIIQMKSMKSKCAELGVPLGIKGITLQESKLRTLGDTSGTSMPDSSSNLPVQLSLGVKQGPLRVEVPNDQVSLNVETPVTTVSSAGKNLFGVAYDPNSGTSYVAAYQNQLLVKPSNSNQAPFTLGSGQQVVVSSSGIGPITAVGQTTGGSTYVSPNGKDMYGTVGGQQGGCHTDPSTGVVTCVDTIGDFSNPEGANQGSPDQGGCYKDPMTGTITCVDSNGNPINTQSGSKTDQPELGSSVPQRLDECETYTSEICGTWTLQGDHINAIWNNGAKATLNVVQFDSNAVVITRQDTVGSSAGLTARYQGRPTGNHVEGSVTWNWKGSTWSGTWKADW